MNPDNNSLERTYFIGGAPRIGKSILAYSLAKEIGGHVVSTDSIRNAAKKASSDKDGDLFIINRIENIPEAEWLGNYLKSPEKIVDAQNRESVAVYPSVVSFCNSFVEDSAVHIVEGVALLPSLVAEMKNKPKHIIYVGNTNKKHVEAMLAYGEKYPQQDWMTAMGYGKDKIEAMANFVCSMSLYFKNEAEKYGFPYYEINDEDFEESIKGIIKKMKK